VIAGGGQERPFLERLVNQLELQSTVHFTGELSREEGLQWINRATLLMVPSYFEPFGLVALEAMHLKRPVIASCVGGLAEIVLDGTTGLLVPPQSHDALYQAMQNLLNQPRQAIEMGQNGYKRAAEQFTLEQNSKVYEKYFTFATLDSPKHRGKSNDLRSPRNKHHP
jgi:glycosyltransferase involved in cell wall biosynthesis